MEFKKYFIVGTDDNALHDTMNGLVTGELICCKDCEYWPFKTVEYADNTETDIITYKHCWLFGKYGYCSLAKKRKA